MKNVLYLIIGLFAISQYSQAQLSWGDIVVNEFVASNDSTSGISDSDGAFPDWLELYNNTNNSVDLTGVYLSDSYVNDQKWQFPAGTSIAANGFLIVWADKDTMQAGGIHTNFKLSAGGEELILQTSNGTALDSLSFNEQTTNVSYARIPNGTGDFSYRANPTFNADNNVSVGIANPFATTSSPTITIFPNPAQAQISVAISPLQNKVQPIQLQIFNTAGQVVHQQKYANNTQHFIQSNIAHLQAGMYLVRLVAGEGTAEVYHQKLVINR